MTRCFQYVKQLPIFYEEKQGSKEASHAQFVQKFSLKSPVYHNCRIYASDGHLLYYCDQRNLELVIKNYYEGRDINREDLEAALLVGMGPRGKRRLSKKKGLVFK